MIILAEGREQYFQLTEMRCISGGKLQPLHNGGANWKCSYHVPFELKTRLIMKLGFKLRNSNCDTIVELNIQFENFKLTLVNNSDIREHVPQVIWIRWISLNIILAWINLCEKVAPENSSFLDWEYPEKRNELLVLTRHRQSRIRKHVREIWPILGLPEGLGRLPWLEWKYCLKILQNVSQRLFFGKCRKFWALGSSNVRSGSKLYAQLPI